MSELINKLIPVIIIVAAVILIIMVIMSWWKRVPQDKAGVVTGIKKKVITGGGGIVIPVINRIDYISLSASSLEITTEDSTPVTAWCTVRSCRRGSSAAWRSWM